MGVRGAAGIAGAGAGAGAGSGAGAGAQALRRRLEALAAAGQGDLRAVVGDFRRGEVLVPVVDDTLLSVQAGGTRWLLVFVRASAPRFWASPTRCCGS
jgi:hypothetical protein